MSKEKKQKHFIQQPVYKGGPKAITEFIYQHLRYPTEAFNAHIEGVVWIDYDIDHKGNVVATRVIQGIGHGCDEEASRVVRLLKFDVAKNRGVNVVFHQKAKITFKKPAPSSTAAFPEQTPAAPDALQQQVQYQYTFTVTTTTTPPNTDEQPAPQVFTYTINM